MKPIVFVVLAAAALTPPASMAQAPASPLGQRALNPQPLPPKSPDSIAAPARLDAPKAIAPTPIQPDPSGMRAPTRGDLFQMEDRAIIIVGGKPVAAGEIKMAIRDAIAKQAGPPRVFKVGARKAAVTSAGAKAAAARPGALPQQNMQVPGVPRAGAKENLAQAARSGPASVLAQGEKSMVVPTRAAPNVRELKCLDRGPPTIGDVSGVLTPGGKISVHGLCLGERPGQVEIIGQFPGGKLKPAFAAWDMTGVELVIPADVRGATDHAVAVTVVTADGRRSAAVQAQFQALRERVEVPASRWSPGSNFELSAADDQMKTSNKAYAGQLTRTVRVNPQCGLDTMEVVALAGVVNGVTGWEAGPPNESSVVIDWRGICLETMTLTKILFVGHIRHDESACRVALQARAWAHCPAGVLP